MTQWTIVSFQDSKLSPWVNAGLDHYLKKMQHWVQLRHITISPTGGRDENFAKQQDWRKFLNQKSLQGHTIVLCDARGPDRQSMQFAAHVQKWVDLRPGVCFIIGPTYGLDRQWVANAHECIKLSSLIFTHELAQLVLAEQLYRGLTISAGIPYHHEG